MSFMFLDYLFIHYFFYCTKFVVKSVISLTGTGIELGLNLFTFGGDVFHKTIIHLLSVGYDLTERDPFIDILQVSIPKVVLL